MVYYEVTLSGAGVVDGPISGVKLPVCETLQEYLDIRSYVDQQEDYLRGVAVSEVYIQNGVSCLCWGSSSGSVYKRKDGTLLNSVVAGAAILEAQSLLPGKKYAPQILNSNNATATFENGTSFTLSELGYEGTQVVEFFAVVYVNQSTGNGEHCTLSYAKSITLPSDDFYILYGNDTTRGRTYNEHALGEYFSSTQKRNWETVIQNETPHEPVPVPTDTDPYHPGGGNTEPGGGEGNPDDTSVPIDFPTLPTVGGGEGVADSGLISIFNPTLTQIKNLAAFMWNSSLFDLSVWQKLYADPMNAIITLSIVPINVPSVVSKVLKVGNISTGLSMNVASKQFIEFDCGSISIEEFWAAYLDYEPYTKFEIFLPYIGYKEISANDIMTKNISLKYHIDILSGACVAYLKCGDSILYSWNGHCSMQIPLSGTDMSQMVTGILGIVGGAATTIGGAMSGNFSVAAAGAEKMASNAINNLKPTIEKTGSIGAASGILGIQTPYIIITRPRQALPFKQNQYTGYPSFMTVTLSSITGFTIVQEIRLQNVPATTNELAEIEELLKQGVII